MKGICRLSGKETSLQNSHIYPKFVIDWLRKTGSKYLRNGVAPNKRYQDGYKKYLLSFEAEQLFGKREKWFAENVFHNYLNSPNVPIDYDENLFFFTISFLWRILVLEMEKLDINKFKFSSTLSEAEEQWRNFLYNGIYPKNFDRVHLMLTDKIKYHNLPVKGVDYYFTRILDGTVIFNDKINFCGVYAKFSQFIFWSYFLNGDESKLEGTKINPINGQLKIPQNVNDPIITGFFINRMKELNDLELASSHQQEKIIEELKSNADFYYNSEAMQSIFRDLNFDEE